MSMHHPCKPHINCPSSWCSDLGWPFSLVFVHSRMLHWFPLLSQFCSTERRLTLSPQEHHSIGNHGWMLLSFAPFMRIQVMHTCKHGQVRLGSCKHFLRNVRVWRIWLSRCHFWVAVVAGSTLWGRQLLNQSFSRDLFSQGLKEKILKKPLKNDLVEVKPKSKRWLGHVSSLRNFSLSHVQHICRLWGWGQEHRSWERSCARNYASRVSFLHMSSFGVPSCYAIQSHSDKKSQIKISNQFNFNVCRGYKSCFVHGLWFKKCLLALERNCCCDLCAPDLGVPKSRITFSLQKQLCSLANFDRSSNCSSQGPKESRFWWERFICQLPQS